MHSIIILLLLVMVSKLVESAEHLTKRHYVICNVSLRVCDSNLAKIHFSSFETFGFVHLKSSLISSTS